MITHVLSLVFILICANLAWIGHPVVATLLGLVYSLSFIFMARRISKQTSTVANPATPKYVCTDCQADAYVGLTGWTDKSGKVMIGTEERLCLACARKRKVRFLN